MAARQRAALRRTRRVRGSAIAAVSLGFRTLALDEIVPFTVPDNRRSRRVMERIGLSHDAKSGFEHPGLPAGDPRRRHVLYRIARERFMAIASD
jgi:RimJ/RimL family protein N-acetyltransferase